MKNYISLSCELWGDFRDRCKIGKVGICGKIEAFSLDEARIPDAE